MNFLILVFVYLSIYGYRWKADPCVEGNHYDMYQPYRRDVVCRYKQDHLCDNLMSSTWYRVKSPMLRYCPGQSSCGALYPIWLDGKEPEYVGEIKEEKVCVVGMTSCCERRYSITMKKCKVFVAYCLTSVKGCPERYCFGNKLTCDEAVNKTTPDKKRFQPAKTNSQLITKAKKPLNTTEVEVTLTATTILLAVFIFMTLLFIRRRYKRISKDVDFESEIKKQKI